LTGFFFTQFLFSESADEPDDQGYHQQYEENAHAHAGFKNPFNKLAARKQNHYQE
jgi:hypothetical protein